MPRVAYRGVTMAEQAISYKNHKRLRVVCFGFMATWIPIAIGMMLFGAPQIERPLDVNNKSERTDRLR